MNSPHTKQTFLKYLVSAFVVFLFSSLVLADTPTPNTSNEKDSINLAFIHYPPYYGNTLRNNGPVMEIISEAYKQEGVTVNAEQMPWSRALKWSKQGKYDALCCAWFREDRLEHFHFSGALPANELVLFKLKERDISYKHFADLKPYQIGLVRDYAVPKGIIENGLFTQIANSDEQNLKKLLAGRIDLALMDRAQGVFISQLNLPLDSHRFEALLPALNTEVQYLVFPKILEQSDERLNTFNRGLAKLKLNGRYDQILMEHKIKESSKPAEK